MKGAALRGCLLTGGSSGIGKALLNVLIQEHPDCALGNLSRTKPAAFTFDAQHRHFEVDLSRHAELEAVVPAVQAWLRALPPGPVLVIHNAGFGNYGPFSQWPVGEHLELIDVNLRAVVALTGHLLPLIRERGGGFLINASIAGQLPIPQLATYAASKAFLIQWGLALGRELRRDGLQVTTLCPGPTRSQFFIRAGFAEAPGVFPGHTAERVARVALRAWEQRRPLVTVGKRNTVMTALVRRLPLGLQARLTGYTLRRLRLDRRQGGRR